MLFFNAFALDSLGDVRLTSKEFKIHDLTVQFEFEVECGKLRKKEDMIAFTLRLKKIKGDVKFIKLQRNLDEIKLKVEDGLINSELIEFMIPDDQVKNEKFNFKGTIILVTSDNKHVYTDLIFEVSPTVFIRSDESKVNFGTLIYENHIVKSTKNPHLPLCYSVLKDAKCKIKSTNNFRMKHQDGCSIKYTVTSDNQISNCSEEDGVKLIDVPKNTNIVNLFFSVDTYADRIPTAGQYNDVLVLSIIPKETK